MTAILASLQQIEKTFDERIEQLFEKSTVASMLLVFIGMPICILLTLSLIALIFLPLVLLLA